MKLLILIGMFMWLASCTATNEHLNEHLNKHFGAHILAY